MQLTLKVYSSSNPTAKILSNLDLDSHGFVS